MSLIQAQDLKEVAVCLTIMVIWNKMIIQWRESDGTKNRTMQSGILDSQTLGMGCKIGTMEN